ncbi:MAG: hypothetical protein JSR33_04300 [Proteobacteria bacterium]|nr:hypothetical protein [Pseudomonadota bacterium]
MNKTEPTSFTENNNQFSKNCVEEKVSHVLPKVAELIRASCLLIGTGFFSIILLMGMNIATHSTTMPGCVMVMGLATFMSSIVSLLTYYIAKRTFQFKTEILKRTSYSELPSVMESIQKLLEVLADFQNYTQAKE